ncbi:MAG: aspartate--tRNA ligase [Candidatus Ryanbacteria bacterium]|nr:aspartate--tRNA ligase [Candidatus Ryanbacteria bacterium]
MEKRIHIVDTPNHVGREVELAGWVDVRRDHGKLIFIDLRDESGVVQMVVPPDNKDLHDTADQVRTEWVIGVQGLVKERPAKMKNDKLPTGGVEIEVKGITILNSAETPVFELAGDGYEVSEEVRLKYRYLDLRRARLQHNIRLRSTLVDSIRQYLFAKSFVEIETPYLTKATAEGSRDFLVPSRLQQGQFYALPQSPQQYKQLIMASGFERYFQIARCFRDEDLRADRGFEHTQLDVEMSFIKQEDILSTVEHMMIEIAEKLGKKIKETPFPRFTYAEAMEKFGADKFDLRTEEEKNDGTLAFAWVTHFPFFERTESGGWTFTHNPFSNTVPEHREKLLAGEIESIIADQYDLVLNGYEAGGGSIRAHEPEVLKKVLGVMGFGDEKIEREYGHMLEAFRRGTPPHGGIALGIDRLTMCFAGETALREVQAFPMTASGKTSVMDAPTDVSPEQLLEFGIQIKKKPAA